MRKSQWIGVGLLAVAATLALFFKPWVPNASLTGGAFMPAYFGYTFCPDVCPTALGELSVALDRLPQAKLDRLETLFISVDPDRDNGEYLTRYAQAFHPKIRGRTGTRDQIDAAVKAYSARYDQAGDKAGDYLIDHTSNIHVMGQDVEFRTKFTHTTSPETTFARLDSIIR